MTPHFTRREMQCPCGCALAPTQAFMDRLEALRVALGRPLHVNSGARCPKHNALVKGAANSYHIQGIAADVACLTGELRYDLMREALRLGFMGIGVNATFVHLDIRPGRPTMWLYG